MAILHFQHSLYSHSPSEMFVVSLFIGVKYINENEIPQINIYWVIHDLIGQWFSPIGSILKNNGLSRPGILI